MEQYFEHLMDSVLCMQIRGNGRGTGTASEAKKKRSESTSDNHPKKPKHESSAVSSSKVGGFKLRSNDHLRIFLSINGREF